MQVRNSDMEKQKNTGAYVLGSAIIGSAIIWGAVILGCSWALKGTDCYDKISKFLIGGTIVHLIIIWGPLATQLIKSKAKK